MRRITDLLITYEAGPADVILWLLVLTLLMVEIPFLRLFLVVRLVTPLQLYVVFFGRRVKTWYLVVRSS